MRSLTHLFISAMLERYTDQYGYCIRQLCLIACCAIVHLLPAQIATEIIRTSDSMSLVTVMDSGNVGIGIADPLNRLHVAGTMQAMGLIITSGASNNYVLTSDASGTGTWQPTQLVGLGGSGNSGYLARFTGSTTLGNSGLFQSGGNFGIGTDVPDRPITIYGTGAAMKIDNPLSNSNPSIFMSNDARSWQIFIDGSNNMTDGFAIRDLMAGQERLIIDTDGDVAIGDLNPTARLHVDGTVKASAFSSTSPLLLQTNGTTRIYVDDTNGKVGIGTTSPASRLHVSGVPLPSGALLQLQGDNIGNANLSTVEFLNSAGTTIGSIGDGSTGDNSIYLESWNGTGGSVSIATGGSERMRVASSGNVGIGTTTPQQLLVLRGNETGSGEQFQISNTSGTLRTWGIGVNSSGGLQIRDETGLTNPISIAAGAATGSISIGTQSISLLTGGISSHIRFSTNATERMRIDVNGNVGIGTSGPAAKLDVIGTVQMTGFQLPTGAANNYVLTSDANGMGTWQAAPGAGTSGTVNYVSKFTGVNTLGNSGIYEDGSGNVGIGTTSPQQLLVLRGNETVNGEQLQISNTAGMLRTWGIGVSSSGGLTIRDETGLVNPISISPGAATGSISIGTQTISLLTGGASSHIRFSTNATERMRIDVSGNVGVGTTSPTTKLEVNGTVKASAFTSASPLLLQTNGTTRIYVNDTTGHVGIGTDSTVNILTVQINSATDPIADGWTQYSSRRWKTNIELLENALANVRQLRGVSYQWKVDGRDDIGFIAEEVGMIYPEVVVYEKNGVDARSVDYSRLVAVLVEAIKEQQDVIEAQHIEIQSMNERLSRLEEMMQR